MKSLQLSKPHLLVMVGMPGSGKSTFATQFAATFNMPFVNYAELHDVVGGDINLTYRLADYLTYQFIRTGQTIIIDGPGDKQADRKAIVKLAREHGYEPLFIWVQTEPATTEHRSVHQRGATMSQSEYDARVAEFDYLTNAEPVLVISGKHTYASQARIVLKRLVSGRPTTQSHTGAAPQRIVPDRGRLIR